ncbi:hypothetical protein B23_2068 [Geobacillus thermoleovorans B23]|nr:hypothetical protein B23_2068 [Geobacillus thermoleovorans B23]
MLVANAGSCVAWLPSSCKKLAASIVKVAPSAVSAVVM